MAAEFPVPTPPMVTAGVSKMRQLMRRDCVLEDFSAGTLRMVVREIYLAMERENPR